VINWDDALGQMEAAGETYKLELIDAIPEEQEITFYSQGDFTDLCAGPHVPSTGKVKALKLLRTAGAYWRGDEKNKMLQRIYGTGSCSRKTGRLPRKTGAGRGARPQ
jgi:threonyl-tRNA synthetase